MEFILLLLKKADQDSGTQSQGPHVGYVPVICQGVCVHSVIQIQF